MKQLKNVIQNPILSRLITLIPVVNMVYPALLAILSPIYKLWKYLLCAAAITVPVLALGSRFVPENLSLLVPYAVTVILSALSLLLLRPQIQEMSRFPRQAKIRGFVAVFAIALLLVLSFVYSYRPDVKNATQTMLQAIVEQDERAFRSACFGSSMDLTQTSRALEAQGIHLEGDVEYESKESFSIRMEGNTEIIQARYRFRIGQNVYLVEVTYQQRSKHTGITALEVSEMP